MNDRDCNYLDELKSGCLTAAMLILVWFLIMIFH